MQSTGVTPIPADAGYLVLPTLVSFLICALVVGVSLFFLSIGEPSHRRVISSAVLLGAGIVSMHYVGIHGLAGDFAITHDGAMVMLSIVIAIAAAYGGLRAFLARQDGIRLTLSAIAVASGWRTILTLPCRNWRLCSTTRRLPARLHPDAKRRRKRNELLARHWRLALECWGACEDVVVCQRDFC